MKKPKLPKPLDVDVIHYGVMDDYVETMISEPICGIPVGEWIDFFKRNTKEER